MGSFKKNPDVLKGSRLNENMSYWKNHFELPTEL